MCEPGARDFFGQSVECTIHLRWSHEWLQLEEGQGEPGSLALLTFVSARNGDGKAIIALDATAAKAKSQFQTCLTSTHRSHTGHTRVADWLRIRISAQIPHWPDPKAIAWGNAAIIRCVREHSQQVEYRSFRPKRLIDIQSQQLKLVRGEDVQGRPIYAALSYCWGSKEESQVQVRTDSEKTDAKFRLEIQDEWLPAVVRDAVATTRSLSIPYLWVDALCIRQDMGSGGDCEEHTGVMDKIYGTTQVTIGAISSAPCQQGFLHPRAPENYIAYRSALQPEASGLLRLRLNQFIRDTEASLVRVHAEAYGLNVEFSKWNSRGWTYQEMVASTRFLAFGKMDMIFSCPLRHWYFGGSQEGAYTNWNQFGLDWSNHNEFWGWDEVISYYGQRSESGFTYLTDMFPALSGLARAYSSAASLPETDYVAGMWKPRLLHNLCWMSQSSSKPKDFSNLLGTIVSPHPYVCPSWSWANRGEFANTLGLEELDTVKP